MKARIYHNPRCSKSRATLALLEDRGIELEVVHYLDDPPTASRLRELLRKLDVAAIDIVRANEEEFRQSSLGSDASEAELLALIERHPRVLQRPIVEIDAAARIGRPPEQVLDLFE